ncbi:MAG: SEC-C metal-binding domain-containing protein [Burkholderiales bacterium]|nr:SEC-C metal-binding domain-containing protein [Burkholderiales bacterium]
MNTSRNEPCPCGSGLRFKRCCGKISDERVYIPPCNSYADSLPFENCGEQDNADDFDKVIIELLQKGNLPQAEILLRDRLGRELNNPKALNFLGWIAAAINRPQFAQHYFSEAVKLAPDWKLPQINLDQVCKSLEGDQGRSPIVKSSKLENHTEKFLLIKAWGYGFWSDVSHVLGQLLVAELTGRIPIVHWGKNSLFGDGTAANAFEFYFEACSDWGVSDLLNENFDFWPPKWNYRNLMEGEVNKWKGTFSRMAGLYLLSRQEMVVVSDFFSAVVDLKPWIPPTHHLYGLSVDELSLYLVRQYLHPKKEIIDAVGYFYKAYLGSPDFIAVHARGSDKILELNNLDEVNRQYEGIINQYLSSYNCHHIFLMTDDARILDYFKKIYGKKIITTDCQRTNSAKGIHYQTVPDRRRLGAEVVVDAYLAAKARAFVGNGFSNPSLMVRYLKDWSESDVHLIGQNMYHTHNTFLHNW